MFNFCSTSFVYNIVYNFETAGFWFQSAPKIPRLSGTGRSGPSRHPGGYWRRLKCPRQPVAGWRDANFLAVVLIHRAGKVFSSSADSIFVSRFLSSADLSFVSRFRQQIFVVSSLSFCQQILSADLLSKQSPFCQPILSTDFSYQIFLKHNSFLGSKHYRLMTLIFVANTLLNVFIFFRSFP